MADWAPDVATVSVVHASAEMYPSAWTTCSCHRSLMAATRSSVDAVRVSAAARLLTGEFCPSTQAVRSPAEAEMLH